MRWRKRLVPLFLRWQYFKPAPDCVAEFEAPIHEARREAFLEAVAVAHKSWHDNESFDECMKRIVARAIREKP